MISTPQRVLYATWSNSFGRPVHNWLLTGMVSCSMQDQLSSLSKLLNYRTTNMSDEYMQSKLCKTLVVAKQSTINLFFIFVFQSEWSGIKLTDYDGVQCQAKTNLPQYFPPISCVKH